MLVGSTKVTKCIGGHENNKFAWKKNYKPL